MHMLKRSIQGSIAQLKQIRLEQQLALQQWWSHFQAHYFSV
jgi:hypothetical protein